MDGIIGILVSVVLIVVFLNFFMFYRRLKRDGSRGSRRAAMEEKEAMVLREKKIRQMLQLEQDEAERHVILQNKTFDLYRQVRERARDSERTDAAPVAAESARSLTMSDAIISTGAAPASAESAGFPSPSADAADNPGSSV